MTLQVPPSWRAARRRGLLFLAVLLGLVLSSFWSLDLRWGAFAEPGSAAAMGRFVHEFWPPDTRPGLVREVVAATWETLAMSLLGTGLAAAGGLLLALPAVRPATTGAGGGSVRALHHLQRLLLNGLRAVPELAWAALLLVIAGLGPLPGTLALALHTTGVLGRLYTEALENVPPGPGAALRAQGTGRLGVLLYATLPQALPQLLSYTLYRWENNIRAAAVLGVVGAGGLGQLLQFHLSLFHLPATATVLLGMLVLVLVVDALSAWLRRVLTA